MPRIVRYRPLDNLGEVRLDLDECPRRFPLYRFDPEDEEPDEDQVLSITIYLTPEGQWVEHIEELDPWQSPPGISESFQEVSPAYVIQELCLQRRDLPPDLAALEPYREAMRKKGPWVLYGPRSKIEPDSQPKRESKPRIVRFHPLDGMGSIRLDLDSCPRRINVVVPVSDERDEDPDNWPLRFRVLYLTPDGRWIEQTKFDIEDEYWVDVFDEIEPDTAVGILWDRFGRLPTELESYRHAFESSTRPPSGERTPEAPAEPPNLVTLDQAAALVHRSKRTLERYKTNGKMPAPTVEGGGGRFDLWDWSTIRPWLMKEFGVIPPEQFPARLLR